MQTGLRVIALLELNRAGERPPRQAYV